jgi:hypothetical protein
MSCLPATGHSLSGHVLQVACIVWNNGNNALEPGTVQCLRTQCDTELLCPVAHALAVLELACGVRLGHATLLQAQFNCLKTRCSGVKMHGGLRT